MMHKYYLFQDNELEIFLEYYLEKIINLINLIIDL